MKTLAALALLLALALPARAGDDPFPRCEDLDQLWTGRRSVANRAAYPDNGVYTPNGYYAALVGDGVGKSRDFTMAQVPCAALRKARTKEELCAMVSMNELRALAIARAAYILDTNRWTRSTAAFKRPIAPDDFVSGPPGNMLNWVVMHDTKGLKYDGLKLHIDSGAQYDNGAIYLAPDNFNCGAALRGSDGMSLALQLVHEGQHFFGGHVYCPGQSAPNQPSCDSDVTEQFEHVSGRPDGGAHGVGAMYSTWIALFSTWPADWRRMAGEGALWVTGCVPGGVYFKGCGDRINDRKHAKAFRCRYYPRYCR
jgi:hypothetical protein